MSSQYVSVYQEWDILQRTPLDAPASAVVVETTPVNPPVFARKLQEARIRCRVTVADLAARVGIPSALLSAYECGTETPSAQVREAIGRELAMTPGAEW